MELMGKDKNCGLTLIELVVVIGIVSKLSSISWIILNGFDRRVIEVAAQSA